MPPVVSCLHMERVVTLLTIRPPRLSDVIGTALSMGATVLSVEHVVGLEKGAFGMLSAPYDKICVETSRSAHKETLETMLEAARSGCRGDGKAMVISAVVNEDGDRA